MKRLVSLLFFCSPAILFSQSGLKGVITDDTLKTPLANAGIYLPELNKRTVSDEKGNYSFGNLPKGKFTVQATHLGYRTFIGYVSVTADENEFNIPMKQTTIEYPEIVVYGNQSSSTEKTANEIVPLTAEDMRLDGALNLSDGISKLPGVSQLTTGAGISKPVIRGMFGNRIQTVLLGLRFDNQQWQDEHGLGLSDIGIDKIEIIKGPSSLLYGSEAMGGVLNIIEEKPAAIGTRSFDFSTRFFSNTFGYTADLGFKKANEKFNFRIRGGTESHADYSDGNNKRILNSRFGGYYFKTTFGFTKGNWISANNYLFSMSNFGFLMDTVQLSGPPDTRLSRGFDRPHHTVFLNILSSQNTFFMERSKLKLNFGVHSNNRMEQEGSNKISLNMLLNTYIVNATWTKNIGERIEFNLGTQDYFQTNKNLGSRTIIPDATQFESSLFSYVKETGKFLVIEGGIRFDIRNVQTFETGTINIADPQNPGNAIIPFNKMYNSLNGAFGFSLFDSKHWNFKSNVSSGYRPGNLAELSSNGLHEGTVRYEIGNIDMKIEQNICADALLAFDSKAITLTASVYYNKFLNYIYLQPTATQYIGFQIFQYIQKDAALQGAEFTADLHPAKLKWMDWMTSYSMIEGKTSEGEYLPFIPAAKINSDLKISFEGNKKFSELFIKPGFAYVFAQERPDQFETPTDAYYSVNTSAGISIDNIKHPMLISVSGNNLLNNAYYDHLSRFKYFGIYNIGRNISVNFKMSFN